MRLPFLILGPACALLGIGAAVWQVGRVSVFYSALAMLGAVTAHISVNAFNEYFDFKSGLDFKTKATPFSGGSGTLPANPQAARPALMTAWTTLGITALIGLYFLWVWGLALLPLGLLGLVIVYIYTNWITRSPFLCLIAPGLGFGILTVMGTNFVLTGQYSLTAFFAALVPFFLVNNLLLL
ncbi:MAG TPA: prenyltransferase, partial [Anaerolineae bacterium]|nr:prenyltransferase [Anaerolineae bacterium]